MTAGAGAQVEIRRLTEADADAFRVLRLAGLQETPEAFGSSYEEEATWPREHFVARAAPQAPSATFGAFVGGRLVGIAGLAVSNRLKQRHKGYMWGIFVRADFRGQGLGRQLVRQVIDTAPGHVRILQCSVVTAAAHVPCDGLRALWAGAQGALRRRRVPRRGVAGDRLRRSILNETVILPRIGLDYNIVYDLIASH
jgi:ribosomal protein S18 acetylase RimI-like enzyme